MVASGYGAVDRVAKVGDSMTGTLVLSGSTPLQITTTTPAAGKVLVSDASGNVSWGNAGVTVPLSLSGSQPASSILTVTNTASTPSVAALQVTSQTTGDRAVGVQVTGDTNRRWGANSDGVLEWGPGNATGDTNLYRAGPSVLQTDDSLVVTLNAAAAGGLQVGSTTPTFGGGSGVLGLANAAVVPNANPASGLVIYSDQDALKWRSSNGNVYTGNAAWRDDAIRPTGAIAETACRLFCSSTASPNSGNLTLIPIWLPKGVAVSSFAWFNEGTAGAGLTHQWAALYNSARVQLAITADKTTTAVPANTLLTWNIATIASGSATSFTTAYTGLHYVGLMIAATTMPSPATAFFANMGKAPLCGVSDTAQTTPPAFPHTAAAPTELYPNYLYMYVS